MLSLVFSCRDPLDRRVEARTHRWEDHLRARHPEVAYVPDAVRRTIEAPDISVSDFDNPNGLNYYRFGALSAPYERLFLKVVVSYREVGSTFVGDVITAYPTGRIARGEVQQWP